MAQVEYEGRDEARENAAMDSMERLHAEIRRQNELLERYGPALESAAQHAPTAPQGSLAHIAAKILTPERMEMLADRLIDAIPRGKSRRKRKRKGARPWLPPVV